MTTSIIFNLLTKDKLSKYLRKQAKSFSEIMFKKGYNCGEAN